MLHCPGTHHCGSQLEPPGLLTVLLVASLFVTIIVLGLLLPPALTAVSSSVSSDHTTESWLEERVAELTPAAEHCLPNGSLCEPVQPACLA